jgi:hypothetical protein
MSSNICEQSNSIQEEIKRRLQSMQTLLSSSSLFKNIKIWYVAHREEGM